MKNKIPLLVAAAVIGATNALCVSAADLSPAKSSSRTAAKAAKPVTPLTDIASESTGGSGSSDSAQLVPKDRVYFRIEEDENEQKFTDQQILEVTSQRQIHFPVTRGVSETIPVNVAGKTLEDVRDEIRKKLEADYYKKATIRLGLYDQTQSYGIVYIKGEVQSGGRYELKPGGATTLSELLMELKPTDFANLKKVRVERLDPVTKKSKSDIVNVREILDKGNRSKDMKLQDGDRIFVDAKTFNLGFGK
jgi:protein involved in polysaccharide export with SLBB domain